MKTINLRKYAWILVLYFILSMEGCSNSNVVSTTPTKTAPTLKQTSLTPSQILPSLTPEYTLSRSSTIMPTITWTLVPTLSSEMAQAALIDLYSDNGDCKIPCWWGISPGETTWTQANEKLAPMAIGPIYSSSGKNGITMYDITYRIPEGVDFPTKTKTEGDFYKYYFNPALFVKDNKVLAIDLNTGWINQDFDYSLSGLLKKLGQPDEIWLRLITNIPSENGPRYSIRLYYKTKGILLSSGGNANWKENKLQICPQAYWDDNIPPSVTLWSPNLNVDFMDINDNLLGGIRNTYLDEYIPLENITEGFGVAEFYKTYLGSGTPTCFEVIP